jgi:hypothetical protein
MRCDERRWDGGGEEAVVGGSGRQSERQTQAQGCDVLGMAIGGREKMTDHDLS